MEEHKQIQIEYITPRSTLAQRIKSPLTARDQCLGGKGKSLESPAGNCMHGGLPPPTTTPPKTGLEGVVHRQIEASGLQQRRQSPEQYPCFFRKVDSWFLSFFEYKYCFSNGSTPQWPASLVFSQPQSSWSRSSSCQSSPSLSSSGCPMLSQFRLETRLRSPPRKNARLRRPWVSNTPLILCYLPCICNDYLAVECVKSIIELGPTIGACKEALDDLNKKKKTDTLYFMPIMWQNINWLIVQRKKPQRQSVKL